MENMEAWKKNYNILEADEKSLELEKTFKGKLQNIIVNTIQSVNEVAEIVKGIVLSENPNLRYQTNDKFNPDEVKAKLADSPGNVLVDILKKNYFDEEWSFVQNTDRNFFSC